MNGYLQRLLFWRMDGYEYMPIADTQAQARLGKEWEWEWDTALFCIPYPIMHTWRSFRKALFFLYQRGAVMA